MPENKKKQAAKVKQVANRKRVNFIKSAIISCAIILLFASVTLNMILIFKVLHLESQVNQLYSYAPVIESQYMV